LDKILWSNWKTGTALKFNISRQRYYKHISQKESTLEKAYEIHIIKHSARNIELRYPSGIINCVDYFDFIQELPFELRNFQLTSVFIEVSKTDEIIRVSNLEELQRSFEELRTVILLNVSEKNQDIVKTKFSYLSQELGRIQQILWKDIDLVLEDYLIEFVEDSYVDFIEADYPDESEEIEAIDLCQNYIDEQGELVVEYFEAQNNFLQKKNNFSKMKDQFIERELSVKELKKINLTHRKYQYSATNLSLKSAEYYRKVDSSTSKRLDIVKIQAHQ